MDEYDELLRLLEKFEQLGKNDAPSSKLVETGSRIVKIFGAAAKNNAFTSTATPVERKKTEWLTERFLEFENVCRDLLNTKFDAAFAFLSKTLLVNVKYRGLPPQEFVAELYRNTVIYDSSVEAWINLCQYDDVRYYLLQTISKEAVNLDRSLALLLKLKYPSSSSELKKFYFEKPKETAYSPASLSSHRTELGNAWRAVLAHDLTLIQLKHVLNVFHEILIHMEKPQLLLDFLTSAYDQGGPISFLALNALFVLIQKCNLDYPHFYTKLYELLTDGSILFSSYRSRFFRLLDIFLTSSHLPATIPASIIKRLLRLALFAPPGAIIAVVPFVYNQLKRHPTCMLMIHREGGPESDPYDPDEPNPTKTGAIDSSLWELQALVKHYQSNTALLAKIFGQPFYKDRYEQEHFLGHSFDSLYATERKPKGSGHSAVEFEQFDILKEIGWNI